jgi:predicted ester cyclase
MNIPPTGKRATVTGMVLFRVTNDKIAEVWVNFDTLGMLQAIGVIPAMA